MIERAVGTAALGLIISAAPSWLAAGEQRFSHLTVDDGLSQSWVRSIVKDSRGLVWIGTQNGLNRYDGTGFTIFRNDPDNPRSLSSSTVRGLLEDSHGRVWVATGAGLCRYARGREDFERVRLAEGSQSLRALAEDRAGVLWIASDVGLVSYDPATGASSRMLARRDDPTSLSANGLSALLVDRRGGLWVSTTAATVDRLDLRMRKVVGHVAFPAAPGAGSGAVEVHGLWEDPDGSLWVSTLGGGLAHIDPKTNGVRRYAHDPDDPTSLATSRVRCVLGDGRGTLYVGTENGGLDVLDVTTGRFDHNLPDPEQPDAISSSSIYALLLDDQGILWVGTYNGGVNFASPVGQRIRLWRARPRGLSDEHVTAVVEDRRGDVWIGTDGGGLDRRERETGRFSVLRHDPRNPASLANDAVLALLEDRHGDLWVSTWTGGLSRLDPDRGRFQRFPSRLPSGFDNIYRMIEDGDRELLLGTHAGAAAFDRRTGVFTPLTEKYAGLPSLVQALLRDDQGGIWLGHPDGAIHIDRGRGRITRYGPDAPAPCTLAGSNVQALFQDSRGNVWIGTRRGLNVVPREGGPIRRYSTADGLPGDAIKDILEDEVGRLWVSTDRGISRLASAIQLPAKPEFLNLDTHDRLQGNEFRHGAAFRSPSGELFFGGNRGLNSFFPRDIEPNPNPPRVILTRLSIFGRPMAVGAPGSPLRRSITEIDSLVLTHKQNFVTIEFAALNYILPEKNQYSYKLEGLDRGWHRAGNQNSATYSHLPPGSYVFRVRAANNDAVWNETGTALRVRVTPPFWGTWWFRLAGLGLLVAGLGAGYLLRVRSLRRHERELARRVEERTLALQLEIGERERAEAALRESEERYALAVRGTADGIWDWNLTSDHVYYSPRWKAILGYGGAEIGDSPSEWFDRVHPEDLARLQAKLAAHRAGPLAHCEDEHRIRHKDGDFRRVLCRAFAVRHESGACVRVVGVITDVTDRRAFDPLTGLPTRNLFLQHLDDALARGRQNPAARVAVLFLDLDRFKMVNDSFGHLVGDRFLIEVANRITACLRPSDLVARFAGDQFALMVSGVSDASDAVRVMERIQHALATPFPIAGTEVFASLTVGIALGTPDYERAEDLLRDGDTALHRAKASGTRRYEVFEPGMRLQVMERLRVESDLRRALERDELRLHYQPILSLGSGRVEGFEGLVRWHHPERGLVMPDKFIRIAEETGLISALGKTVMRQACRQLREWRSDAELPEPVWISVNVSAKEFLDSEFVARVRELVAQNQIPRGALRVEITETTLLEGDQFVRASLERLRELGVGVDIDDFGTGYSSLGYLQQLTIDTLKIDRVFVKRLDGPAADTSIVRAILDMAKSLGLSVVAEGVETRQQLDRLAHLGCQKVQGYYISAALESGAARSLLLQRENGITRA